MTSASAPCRGAFAIKDGLFAGTNSRDRQWRCERVRPGAVLGNRARLPGLGVRQLRANAGVVLSESGHRTHFGGKFGGDPGGEERGNLSGGRIDFDPAPTRSELRMTPDVGERVHVG